jgi:hypothetical protein
MPTIDVLGEIIPPAEPGKRVRQFDQTWRSLDGALHRVADWLARDEPIPPLTLSLVCDLEVIVASLTQGPKS